MSPSSEVRNAAPAVRESFARCSREARFFDRFYQIFIGSDPDVANRLAATEMSMQKRFLHQGLNMVIMAVATENDGALKAIERIRNSHGKDKLAIPARHYDFWVESLVTAVAETDPAFGPELEAQWRQVLAVATVYMRKD